MTETKGPASGQGGVGSKKKRRKRGTTAGGLNSGGGSGGGGGVGRPAPQMSAGRGGGGKPGGISSGSKPKRRGGGGSGGRGGGGGESSRYGRSAASPMQLPHTKVTLRNVVGGDEHGSIDGVVNSVRSFLEAAFGNNSDAYTKSWKLEKEGFEGAKAMFAEVAASNGAGEAAATVSSSSSSTSRAFFSGWVYEEKPESLPFGRFDRLSLLPTTKSVVTNLMENKTDRRVSNTTNINWIVDTAMSQMMQECGKKYLDYVGGRIFFDEDSAVDAVLAERVQAEKRKKSDEKEESNADGAGASSDQITSCAPSVEEISKGVKSLTTNDKPHPAKQQLQGSNQMPSVRVRILSVTPVKKSKRRGEIGGKVQLALYPPDPCLIFKETCREAGKMAAEMQLERVNATPVSTEVSAVAQSDGKEAVKEVDSKAKGTNNSKTSVPSKMLQMPQIPHYPLLPPAERSRAVARSRVLLHRTVEALRLHSAMQSNVSHMGQSWKVFESSSQKTWKSRPHPLVGQVIAGAKLSELVAEQESSKANGLVGGKKGRVGVRGDSRADRYDSTIEGTEDYKLFMESLKDGGSAPAKEVADGKDTKHADEEPRTLDEEGRPLSAIVMHIRARQDEERKAKAEAAAAAARARAAAAAAKEKVRKERAKVRKEASKKKKKESTREKNHGGSKTAATSSSRLPSSGGNSGGGSGKGSGKGGNSMPPAGAMLLKKGGASGVNAISAIPPSGFG